jgi:hypothetical protein
MHMEALSTFTDNDVGALLELWGVWARLSSTGLYQRRAGVTSRMIEGLMRVGDTISEDEVTAVDSVVRAMPGTMREVVERTWLRQLHDLEGAHDLRMTLDAYHAWQHRACRHLAGHLLIA